MIIGSLRAEVPNLGRNVAIDATDLPAWANGHRFTHSGQERERYADPDASWVSSNRCIIAKSPFIARSPYRPYAYVRPFYVFRTAGERNGPCAGIPLLAPSVMRVGDQ